MLAALSLLLPPTPSPAWHCPGSALPGHSVCSVLTFPDISAVFDHADQGVSFKTGMILAFGAPAFLLFLWVPTVPLPVSALKCGCLAGSLLTVPTLPAGTFT